MVSVSARQVSRVMATTSVTALHLILVKVFSATSTLGANMAAVAVWMDTRAMGNMIADQCPETPAREFVAT